MSKSAMIRARTEPKLKNEVENIFHELGLSCTEAINIFYRQVKLLHGLPFDVKIPNKTTLKAMKDVNKRRKLHKAKNAKELFNKLGI
ncbi:MAG: type II toxin-antitoxin system RelB/DinJ family antitoxin [Candidatus Aureabacteria bacterium]|nr:type II toxin-antitoxin system RelB/DinJ family antitoxin [Candidatus Auribacterota bacterium]